MYCINELCLPGGAGDRTASHGDRLDLGRGQDGARRARRRSAVAQLHPPGFLVARFRGFIRCPGDDERMLVAAGLLGERGRIGGPTAS